MKGCMVGLGQFLVVIVVLAVGWLTYSRADEAAVDSALKDRVGQLVERLGSKTESQSDAAVNSLIKLGPKILPLLPEAGSVKSAEVKQRVQKVRAALTKAADDVSPGASRVTIEGKGIRLSEAIQQLQKQTGNAVSDLREQLGAEVTSPALDLNIKKMPFLEALDLVARRAEIGTTYFTGDGSIGLTGGMASADATKGKPASAGTASQVLYSGPFRIMLKEVGLLRSFETGTNTCKVQFEVGWEPRLRPMLMALKMDEIKVFDDRNKEVKAQAMMESNEIVIRPENPATEINLDLQAPERAATKLSRLGVKGELTIPAGLKLFKFPSLTEENVTLKQDAVSVTLVGMEIDEQVWKVNVQLDYPGGGADFESYRQGLFNNRVWLERADGSRFALNGGFSNTGSDGGKMGFEYLFVDAPGKPADYQVAYETPSKVIKIPLEFEFKDVLLP
jgi:hypothetical protein